MRFLVFNIVVFGALFYLFTADRGDIHAVADRAHAAVDRIEDAAARTVDKVNGIIDRKTRNLPRLREEPRQPFEGGRFEPVTSSVDGGEEAREVGKTVAEATPPPAAVPPSDPPSAEQPESQVESVQPSETPSPRKEPKPSSTPVSAPTQLAAADSAKVASSDAGSRPRPDRVQLDGQEIPARWIPPVAVNKPTYEVTEPAAPNPTNPSAKAPAESADVPAAPANRAPEIAIADGSELMSPQERRLELFSLAEDMELLFLEKLGE